MNNLNFNKKSSIIVAVVFVLIIILAVVAGLMDRGNNNDLVTQDEITSKVQKKEIDNTKIPAGLPSNLPSEPGTKVLQNFESTAPDGRTQSTRIVTSNEQPRAALEIYISFFKKLGYQGGFDATSSKTGGPQIAHMVKDNNAIMLVTSPYTDRDQRKETTKVEISLFHR